MSTQCKYIKRISLLFILLLATKSSFAVWNYHRSEDPMTDSVTENIYTRSLSESATLGSQCNAIVINVPAPTKKRPTTSVEIRFDQDGSTRQDWTVFANKKLSYNRANDPDIFNAILKRLKNKNTLKARYYDIWDNPHVMRFSLAGFSDEYERLNCSSNPS